MDQGLLGSPLLLPPTLRVLMCVLPSSASTTPTPFPDTLPLLRWARLIPLLFSPEAALSLFSKLLTIVSLFHPVRASQASPVAGGWGWGEVLPQVPVAVTAWQRGGAPHRGPSTPATRSSS